MPTEEAKQQYLSDAEADDRQAGYADYFVGYAKRDDPSQVERIEGEAKVLRAWAELNRYAADAPADDDVPGEAPDDE